MLLRAHNQWHFYSNKWGFKTIANDFLNFNNQIGLALIENKHTKQESSNQKILQ